MTTLSNPTESTPGVMLLALFLLLIAAVPRFYDLGGLGFYGDEETTALPAASYAQGGDMSMPTGMPYTRAIPFTWLNALSARLIGVDRELAYRVPASIFGVLTVPLFFLLARSLFGTTAAFVAALMLALSEWHLITSREARMYAPMLFAYVASALLALRWLQYPRPATLILALAAFLFCISLQVLGVTAALFFVCVVLLPRFSVVRDRTAVLIGAACVAAALAYDYLVARSPVFAWRDTHPRPPDFAEANDPSLAGQALAYFLDHPISIVLAIAGVAVGLWLGRETDREEPASGRSMARFARLVLAGLTGILVFIGQLYGAALVAVCFLLAHEQAATAVIRRAAVPCAVLVTVGFVWMIVSLALHGALAGLKELARFPFPYFAFLFSMAPGVTLLFAVLCSYLLLSPARPEDMPMRASVIGVIFPVAAVGAAEPWGGVRYVMTAYPFLVLLGAAGLVLVVRRLVELRGPANELAIGGLAALMLAAGVLGGHGIPQVLRVLRADYGSPMDVHAFGFPLYPDHRGAGEFVRQQLRPDDVVVAIDALEQQWYVGRVDYWLRHPVNSGRFMYLDESNVARDVYTGAITATEAVLQTFNTVESRVWVITSAEVEHHLEYDLDASQLRWLQNLSSQNDPVFLARDATTRVYCLNCRTSAKDVEHRPSSDRIGASSSLPETELREERR